MKLNVVSGLRVSDVSLNVLSLTEEDFKKIKSKPKSKVEKLLKPFLQQKDLKLSLKKSLFLKIPKDKKLLSFLLVGLEKSKEVTEEKLRRAFSEVISVAKSNSLEKVSIFLPETKVSKEKTLQAITTSIVLGNYSFDKYKSYSKDNPKKVVKSVSFNVSKSFLLRAKKLVKESEIIANSTIFVRDLQNENANIVTSLYMEKVARKLSKKNKLKIKVLNEKNLKKLGMNLILAVNAGSAYPPRTIFLEYKGNPKSKNVYAVVGKGITFDTGGTNLKPTNYIENMRMDMSGAAIALGTIKAVSELKLKVNVLCAFTVTDNAIGPKSYLPGDIFKSYSGKSVEIGNTDAEGRLILADTLAYTEKNFKPKLIIDIATLTGAIKVALGDYFTGMFGNTKSKAEREKLFKLGQETGERVWELPLDDDFKELMKSDFADIKNVSSIRYAGSITAGIFLQEFIKSTPWIHLDVAGTAMPDQKLFYHSKHGSGWGVRILTEYFKSKQ